MIIKNVKVYTENQEFIDGEIVIHDGRFGQVGRVDKMAPNEDLILDGEGCYAIPGLIDLHFHGCKGYDFCDGTREAIEKIAEYEAFIGVTAIAPATVTLPTDELERILSVAADYKKETDQKGSPGADLVGINMEGPFISGEKKGAQDERNIVACNMEVCRRFLKASEGLVKFVGVAPEKSADSWEFIRTMKDQVHVSLAHTNADYDTAMAAFDAGADHAVHLYNAMPAFAHRTPGVVGAVADSPHVSAELICDGVHVHPSVVRATFRMLGADRIVLISDSMRAAGMPDGRYMLGGLEVEVRAGRATLVSDGTLAGSVSDLMENMRTVVQEMGIPLETAVACATRNPAKCLGIYDAYGSIAPGKKGNVVLLNSELNVKAVIKDGIRIR